MLETIYAQLIATTWVEWLGMLTGIVGVWLSIKEKIAAWPLFIACYACYVYISYEFGLRAFLGMNVVFIGISIYGWIKWSRPSAAEAAPELPVSRTARRHWLPLLGTLGLGTLAVGALLQATGETQVPYLDAFATCCGFVAQWMLSRKHIETWLFWILSDLIYLGLFAAGGSWPSVFLFATFITLAIKGWRDWDSNIAASASQHQATSNG